MPAGAVKEKETSIYPTHTCFDDALDYLCDILKSNPAAARSNEYLLVHGICVSEDLGQYSHAWLEQAGKFVLWTGILNGERVLFKSDIAGYYKKFQVQETTKYTPRQAWEENAKHVTYGPWIEKYKILCRHAEARRPARALGLSPETIRLILRIIIIEALLIIFFWVDFKMRTTGGV